MMNNLEKDTMESDLWCLDEEEDGVLEQAAADPVPVPEPEEIVAPDGEKPEAHQAAPEEPDDSPAAPVTKEERPVPEPVQRAPRSGRRTGITFGERESNETFTPSTAVPATGDDELASDPSQPLLPGARDRGGSSKSGVSLSVSVARPFELESAAKPANLEDLGELDDWDDPNPPRRLGLTGIPGSRPAPEDSGVETETEKAPTKVELVPGEAKTDEFSVKPAPNSATPSLSSLRPKLGLSKIEQLGLAALAVMLVAAGAFALHYTLGRLPTTSSSSAQKVDFPVKGKLITVTSAATHWREPETGGDAVDIIRRGTLLIPVIDLEMTGSSGAVRIFFRDGTGKPIGDPISRVVPPSGKLSAAASAGFEGTGDYAAYSTQEIEPWSVEVHEGPSAAALFQEFNKLFEIPVSTYRH